MSKIKTPLPKIKRKPLQYTPLQGTGNLPVMPLIPPSHVPTQLNLGQLMPLQPMLAKPINTYTEISDYSNYIMEEKFDGERLLVVFNNHEFAYYTRTLKSTSESFNIQFTTAIKNIILDGEKIFIDEDQKIIPICDTGCRQNLKAMYHIFDVQYFNDEWVIHKSVEERKNIISRYCRSTQNVQLVPWQACLSLEHTQNTFETIIARGGEGVILKQQQSIYTPNLRKWIKVKSLHLIDKKTEYELYCHRAIKDKHGVYNILECGYYTDHQQFVCVCKVSSGFSHALRNQIRLYIDANGYFLQPIIVSLVADKITVHKSLRHPSIQRLRFDLDSIDYSQFV